MVRTSCGGVGEFKDGIFHPVVMCLLRLVSAIGRVVDLWDDVGVYIRDLEGVSYIIGLFCSSLRLMSILCHSWLLYASGTVLGSVCSFIVSRTVLSKFVNRLMERDKRFAALALTLKYDGLKLLCMIRLCPLPYSICNGGVSTFPTVHPLMYGLATLIISPKLLVPTFIGSRLRLLADKNEEMSLGSKAVNVGSIIFTVAVGVFTGWYIYKRYVYLHIHPSFPKLISWISRTLSRAKELEAKEREDIRNSLNQDHAANRPHRRFSRDPKTNTAATTLARDEEERAGFHDFDDDNVDIVIADDSDSDRSNPKKTSPYHDEFTDNDSDVFRDGDGSAGETYQLHSHRSNSRSSSKSG